ncbi:hypothetical protein V8G54_000350 [Vigna mungo]|uniref:Secreted protein n=1 Tax=Vigna mungo TaxID=3915 RepID=A0AAQ3P4F5_VIGMU
MHRVLFLLVLMSQLYNNFSKPLWDVIAHMVSSVPLPTPGKERVLFAIESCLLSVEAPPIDWLPHADVQSPKSFFLGMFAVCFSFITSLADNCPKFCGTDIISAYSAVLGC